MDSKQKIRIFVAADCLCIFQMFKLTFRAFFFLTLTLLCTLYNQLKFFWRMLILRGWNGLEPKKFEFLSPPTVLAFLQTLNQHFDLIFKNIILSKCFMRIIFKNIYFIIFIVKKQSLYLCKYTNLYCFLLLKICWGPHFFSYSHNFVCEVLEDPK